MPLKALVAIPPKTVTTTPLIVATTLGLGGDTSIANIDSQIITQG